MNSRELVMHVNAMRKLLRERGLQASDASTVASWTLIACGLNLLDNRMGDELRRFVLASAETALKEADRANFRIGRDL